MKGKCYFSTWKFIFLPTVLLSQLYSVRMTTKNRTLRVVSPEKFFIPSKKKTVMNSFGDLSSGDVTASRLSRVMVFSRLNVLSLLS